MELFPVFLVFPACSVAAADVTLLYASKNRVENHAVILKEFIEKNLN